MTENSTKRSTWIRRIRTLLQSNRKPMNNDEWTVFAEKLTHEQRQAVEQARAHYFDDALKSYLMAFLKMLEGHEEHLTGLRQQTARYLGNQELITEHLGRQDAKLDLMVEKVGAVGGGLAALTDQFRETGEALSEWRAGMDSWRADIDSWREQVEVTLAGFRESRDRSMRQHEETREHRALQDQQMDELLKLVYKLGNDLTALKAHDQ